MPYESSCQPQVGFLRFLRFLKDFDFNMQMVVVNFNEELSGNLTTFKPFTYFNIIFLILAKLIKQFENDFQKKRSTFPPMFIVTPYDDHNSVFSKTNPSKEIVKRLALLAKASYEYLVNAYENGSLINVAVILMIINFLI